MTRVAPPFADGAEGYLKGDVLLNGATTSEVEIVALKRNLSVLLGTVVLAASLTACGSGGQTDSGNAGKPTPTAVPTHDNGGGPKQDDDSNKGPDGSGSDTGTG